MAKLEIYLPVQHHAAGEVVKQKLLDEFNGFTSIRGIGLWKSKEGVTYVDTVDIVTVYSNTEIELGWVYNLVAHYKKDTGEECVLISLDKDDNTFDFL